VLFQFPIAFALNQQWVERHPEDWSALSDFAEKHFTTGRFSDCAERLATLLANPEIESCVQVALQQFFDAVEGQDRQAILAGLQAASAAFTPGRRQ
jgi:hypothetical protein